MSERKNKRIGNWFKGLRTEFQRIIWPTRDDLVKETSAVLIVSILLGGIIAVLDSIIKFLINLVLK